MDKYVIVVAGGKGLRMGSDIPKQFLPVKGKPILMLTLEAFVRYDKGVRLVLVLPESQQEYWNALCKEYNFTLSYKLANGGETRFHSVKNGLSCVSSENSLVAVHDGVRPFVSIETIEQAFISAEKFGSAVPVIDSVDSVRELTTNGDSIAKDRSRLKLVQTPQIFQYKLLRKAYEQTYTPQFTDDASVVESSGAKITLTQGNRENIKITTAFDLKVAEIL